MRITRAVAYILTVVGVIYIADAAYDERRGVADALSPGRSLRHYVIARTEDPEQFRNLMAYQWIRGPVFLLGGVILLGFCRRADRLDPFSPHFGGSYALDDLNRTLSEEEQRRHHPLK